MEFQILYSSCLYISVFGGTPSSRLTFFLGLAFGLVLSFLVACFTSLTSFSTTIIQTKQIASNGFRSFLDARSFMQVTENTKDLHDVMDKNLRPVQPVMVDDAHYHNG